ncbi:hypothetical protein N7520_011103 [Penicillium odoratum]|uniref:uncharacterized protein n=1 Tax=Penicillium odoratum TaxID=1167516 RepID=UPI0025474088|nr:uncharacterized protein N7520_011103 [Penicillium odoratum]KAJ5745921.1 hypothetical protein N7520_011103 [Penicillium odoratum]
MSSKQETSRLGGNVKASQPQSLGNPMSKAAQQKKGQQQQDLGPTQLLAEHMDTKGNPVPDSPAGPQKIDDIDVYEAMTKDFD